MSWYLELKSYQAQLNLMMSVITISVGINNVISVATIKVGCFTKLTQSML